MASRTLRCPTSATPCRAISSAQLSASCDTVLARRCCHPGQRNKRWSCVPGSPHSVHAWLAAPPLPAKVSAHHWPPETVAAIA
eukprot:334842-Amphidinium_carterae.1